jgi:hypothetical protein
MRNGSWMLAAVIAASGLTAAPARADWFSSSYYGWYGWLFGPMSPLIGRDLNGVALNGTVLEGRAIESVSLDGVTARNGEPIVDVTLEGAEFHGRGERRRAVPPERFVGAVFDATLVDGGTVALRIDGMERGHTPNDRDITRYRVSYATAGGWQPLCGVDPSGHAIPAVPLEGRWDPGQGTPTGGAHLDDESVFTFACEGYVLAHCVEAGYAPWRQAMVCRRGHACERVDLAPWYQACTRMMRADYCGDGTPHTVDGTPINVYDAFRIRVDSESWLFEAEWDEDGARCMVEERLSGHDPACMADLVDPNCGDPAHFGEGALLFSEVRP